MKNEAIINFTKNEIKSGLEKLNDGCQLLFKRMYSHNNLNATIQEAVDGMDIEKLDWALSQVQRSLQNPNLLRQQLEDK